MEFESSSLSSSSSSSSSSCKYISHKRKAGRKKFRETRHPIYKGVRQRNADKWVSEVREPCKKSRIWLGTFPTPEMAARAYDVAAIALRGHLASLNFPDSSWMLPRAASSSVRDIQLAAIQAARAFHQPASSLSSSPLAGSRTMVLDSASSVVVEDSLGNSKSSENAGDGSQMAFVDEEAVFNMPGLIDSMAEGLLLTPPALSRGFSWDEEVSNNDQYVSLWNHD